MMDFPSSPSVGQIFNNGAGTIYIWDGVAWSISTSQTKTARRTNLVINGAINVSQENGNTEGTANGYYAADQFNAALSASGAAIGFGRIANANQSGSQYRLQYRVTTAKASLAAGDFAAIETKLEGLNVQDLAWSVAGQQKDAVLAFGFRGPAGTYAVAIRNAANTHAFVTGFTITAGQANTDTTQVIKVPAPAGMTTWAVDNTIAIDLWITLAAGSTYLGSAGWNSGAFIGVTGMSNGLAAVQSFQIWDLYFGADPDKTGVPPVFEVPDYATELAKCCRYFQTLPMSLYWYATGGIGMSFRTLLPVAMRATPSTSSVGSITYSNASTLAGAGPSSQQITFTATTTATGAASVNWQSIINARM